MKPIIKEVAEECSAEYEFINVEAEDSRIQKYLVMSTPTIVIEDGGQMKARFVGFQSADILKAAIISPEWR
jgi:protein-disulfide isomerase